MEAALKKTLFIKNTVILTATSLILRFIGIIFKVWLAALIGSEGIGLHQLIFSVYILASTFASSGIVTAVTKLTAEELAVGSKKGASRILRRSIELTLIIALVSALIVFFGADFIAKYLLEDMRAATALKLLPLSLPFMGLTSCIRGYFIARRNVTPNAVTQILEQILRILFILFLVKRFINYGLSACCAAVIGGDILAEIFGFFIMYLCYIFDKKKKTDKNENAPLPRRTVSKILHIALPITSGRYLNTLLRTAENILVPKNLARHSLNGSRSLSQFGMIKGMALPIIFFPSALLNSISTLLIPEISEAIAKKRKLVVKNATENILKLTAIISFIFSAIFFIAGRKIGVLIYKENDVGFLLQALSPIIPFMYLDSISDGILKGMDQQIFSFRTAIFDSVIRIILVLILLPNFGLPGFIGIMYFSNFLTCFLNVGRLMKISEIKFKILEEFIFPLFSAFSVTVLTNYLITVFNITNNLIYTTLICTLAIPLYLCLLFFLGTLNKDDIKGFIR